MVTASLAAALALAAAAPLPQSAPPGRMISWDSTRHPNPQTYAIGGAKVTLRARMAGRTPQVVVTFQPGSGRSFEAAEEQGLPLTPTDFGVGRIDPATGPDQLVFTTFSGGAHCCTDIYLVERLEGRWQVVHVDRQDPDLKSFPRDLDGDGRREFRLQDDRFLYAFNSYGGSYAPPKILAVEQGQVKDVSASPRFRPVYRAYAASARNDCLRTHNNSACAAFAAAAARLDELDRAWPVVLAAYDRGLHWFPIACRPPAAETPCPKDQQVAFESFPQALRWFLGDTGYAPPVPLP